MGNIGLLVIGIGFILLIRNHFVYKFRTSILDLEPISKALEIHDTLPGYHYMALYFWKPMISFVPEEHRKIVEEER